VATDKKTTYAGREMVEAGFANHQSSVWTLLEYFFRFPFSFEALTAPSRSAFFGRGNPGKYFPFTFQLYPILPSLYFPFYSTNDYSIFPIMIDLVSIPVFLFVRFSLWWYVY